MRQPIASIFQFSTLKQFRLRGFLVFVLCMNTCLLFALLAQNGNAQNANSASPPAPAQNPDDSAELPPGFKPPGTIPDVMTMSKELLKPEEHREFAKIRRDYNTALRNGKRNSKNDDYIKQGIRYRIYHLADKSERNHLHDLTADLLRDINSAGRLLTKQSDIERFREFVLAEVVTRCSELLDNNFYVRVQAIIILSQLNLTNPKLNSNPPIPEQAYVPAAEPLLKVINDPEQLVSLRVPAVVGLRRIAWLGDVNNALKLRMADALIREIGNKEYHWWYQMRICEALGTIDLATNPAGNPIIVQTLMNILLDKNQHWRVRSAAAEALGRAPLDNKLDVSLINYKICQFAEEMAKAINSNPNAFYWKRCIQSLYLAYKPRDEREKEKLAGLLTKANQTGMTLAQKKAIDDAYHKLLPIFIAVIKGPPNANIPVKEIDNLSIWMKENQPQSQSLAPGLPPISNSKAITTTSPQG